MKSAHFTIQKARPFRACFFVCRVGSKKGNEKAPDFQLFIRDSINTQESEKVAEIPPKIEPSKANEEDVYKMFGEMTESDLPDDYPF